MVSKVRMTAFSSDFADLVTDLRVHRAVYTDPQVFALEQERIFRRAWLYVGHESQVPERGDWVLTRLGPQEMILIRGDGGNLSLLHNRCPHRGSRLLSGTKGRVGQIVCPYHAWSFAADGKLTGVPLPAGYGPDFDLNDLRNQIERAPRVESWRGFVFASHAPSGPGLGEFLGGIALALDNLVDRAPEGRVRQVGGALRMQYRGNWKLFMENAVDLVHPGFVHASAVAAARADADAAALPGVTGQVVQMQLANGLRPAEWDALKIHAYEGGHISMDSFYRQGVIAAQRSDPVFQRYFEALSRAHGELRAKEILSVDRFNNLIWPNLSVNSRFQAMRVIEPLAVDLTQVTSYCFALEGAPPEMSGLAVRFLTAAASAGSLVAADDLEIFERCQRGLLNAQSDWIDISRGLGRDEPGSGELLAPGTSEIPIRWQLGTWRKWMARSGEAS
jgi:phenylpropionate dioxygenase-like ring-hydroxylating dioxygenase large terminal subunit